MSFSSQPLTIIKHSKHLILSLFISMFIGQRYTIGNLHKSQITAIEWSKNGMRLFSGDKNGVIIMTEIDFYMVSVMV